MRRFIASGENMGRKGVSKRKPLQPKDRPLSKNNTIADALSVGRAKWNQVVKPPEPDKAVTTNSRGNIKHPSDSRKNPQKR
jgi:hypothetical protein